MAQQHSDSLVTRPQIVRATIVDGDTILVHALKEVRIYEEREFKSAREARKYGRLKRDVMVVYPYAKLAGEKLRQHEGAISKIKGERKRKKYYKLIEKELEEEFGEELSDLTIKQGTILISLLDRETGDTSYELVKELRGTFSAFFWQSLARVFGHDLKDDYDPEGEEEMIEEIVLLIENGVYSYDDRVSQKTVIKPIPSMEIRK
ncbi:DUF4294 domain-containing protein [Flavobacteriales bacterium]|nr:DUF4294 domain-containing protein [Flavobacteriales bacterium]